MNSNSLKFRFSIVFTLILFNSFAFSKPNNACNSFKDYLTMAVNPNCFHQEDMALNPIQLINKYAGKAETYKVTTEDGYILTMYRIPRSNAKKVILVQHALGVDGRIWVSFNDSLGIFLWHQGYDVWISNMRGTRYSKGHVSLSYSDPRYWKWSIHDVGVHDVSAQVRLIKNITNAKITFAGHSLGTTVGLVYGTAKHAEAKELLEQFVFMGTAATYKFNTNALIMVAKFEPMIKDLVNMLGLDNVLFFLPILVPFSKMIVQILPMSLPIVFMLASVFCGWSDVTNPAQFNADGLIMIQTFSWPTILHFLQLMDAKTSFKAYDYGNKKDNKLAYGTINPPVYPVENFSVPILFISGENDILTTGKDTEFLINEYLPKKLNTKHIIVKGMNHNDYQIGTNKEAVFFDLINHIESNKIET